MKLMLKHLLNTLLLLLFFMNSPVFAKIYCLEKNFESTTNLSYKTEDRWGKAVDLYNSVATQNVIAFSTSNQSVSGVSYAYLSSSKQMQNELRAHEETVANNISTLETAHSKIKSAKKLASKVVDRFYQLRNSCMRNDEMDNANAAQSNIHKANKILDRVEKFEEQVVDLLNMYEKEKKLLKDGKAKAMKDLEELKNEDK